MTVKGNNKKGLFSDIEMLVAYEIDVNAWEMGSIKLYQDSLGVGGVELLLVVF
tara:strand:+ start:380 stop:538 length:159 start_codon:yes stop_codon:yes gene_type:complete